jgi:hypothetical protein
MLLLAPNSTGSFPTINYPTINPTTYYYPSNPVIVTSATNSWPHRPLHPHRAPHLDANTFGCVADNSTDNRAAITRALAACTAASGCTLTFPSPGIYITGPIALVSNLTLIVPPHTTLHGARSNIGWPVLPFPEYPSAPNGVAPPGGGQFGPYHEPTHGAYVGWLRGYNVSDIIITGGGTLDGGGKYWRSTPDGDNSKTWLPYMLHFEGTERVHLMNLRVQEAAFWTIHFQYSSEIVVEQLSVYNSAVSVRGGGCFVKFCFDVFAGSRGRLIGFSPWLDTDSLQCTYSPAPLR